MSAPALAVRCGVCGAPAGQACRTRSKLDKPHVVRVAAAKRARTGVSAHSQPPVPSWLEGRV